MTRIAVEKATDISADTETLTEQIRALAYHLFESRGGNAEGNPGGNHGRDLDDWLEAERQLILTPESVLVERDGRFEIRIAAPGFDAGDIRVTATPGALLVKAASKDKTGNKTLLGTIDLPGPIDAGRTTARLDNGTLFVTAVRKSREREPAAV